MFDVTCSFKLIVDKRKPFLLVHGLWNPWTLWTDCSTSCENGTRTRNRTCDGPYYGGDDCTGAGHEIEACFLRWCPGMNLSELPIFVLLHRIITGILCVFDV